VLTAFLEKFAEHRALLAKQPGFILRRHLH
jgi:hypothetical protein